MKRFAPLFLFFALFNTGCVWTSSTWEDALRGDIKTVSKKVDEDTIIAIASSTKPMKPDNVKELVFVGKKYLYVNRSSQFREKVADVLAMDLPKPFTLDSNYKDDNYAGVTGRLPIRLTEDKQADKNTFRFSVSLSYQTANPAEREKLIKSGFRERDGKFIQWLEAKGDIYLVKPQTKVSNHLENPIPIDLYYKSLEEESPSAGAIAGAVVKTPVTMLGDIALSPLYLLFIIDQPSFM